MNATHPVNDFFLSEDLANFSIENDNSPIAAKPIWIQVKRYGNFHLALALSVQQAAIGPLMQFSRDMSMSCELESEIDEKSGEFSFHAFFDPKDDGSTRIIL